MLSSGHSYEDALDTLNTLINRNGGDFIPADSEKSWNSNFEMTFKHLKILELETELDNFSIIHVAGTKGKGSTCAFTERMLRESGFRTGLFTSPHLFDVRERFRFDGVEVSKELFTESFWWVYDRLKAQDIGVAMPGFFRFMLLLALRMFSIEKVDVVILEVGLGGRLDATNVVRAPAVCGITSLGLDHTELLGNTIGEIAGEKAGIFKVTVPAITSPQVDEAMEVLKRKAEEKQIILEIAPPLESYGVPNLQLGLKGEHQRTNAALAVALCRGWAQRSGNVEHWSKLEARVPYDKNSALWLIVIQADDQAVIIQAEKNGGLPESYVRGLASTSWAGRAETITDTLLGQAEDSLMTGNGNLKFGKLQFYLDGAHSPESMEACGKWFCDSIKEESEKLSSPVVKYEVKQNGSNLRVPTPLSGASIDILFRRVLLFNCMPRRDPLSLLPPLVNMCHRQGYPFDMAVFTPQLSSYLCVKSPSDQIPQVDLSWQLTIQKHWESIQKRRMKELNGMVSSCTPAGSNSQELFLSLEHQKDACRSCGPFSAVMESLPATLEWLRICARRNPQLQIQVLVTGSLYLVGDMLRLLKHR